MTGAGYVWIVTEQALETPNAPEGLLGLKLINATDEKTHIKDSLYVFFLERIFFNVYFLHLLLEFFFFLYFFYFFVFGHFFQKFNNYKQILITLTFYQQKEYFEIMFVYVSSL